MQVASDLGCSPDAVVTNDLGSWRERVSCNGKELLYYRDDDTNRWMSPLDRAVFEMSCPKEQLVANVIDNQTVGVTGCGKKVLYLMVTSQELRPMGVKTKHTWVVNTESAAEK